MHRTGRTGRAGKKGTALTLVGPQDFLAFNAIKGLDLELKKVEVPSDVEVATAQLTHLKKNLRDTAIKLTPRDSEIAKLILKEEPEKAERMIAALSLYTLEHLVKVESVSLEEELDKEESKPEKTERRPRRDNKPEGGRKRRPQSRGKSHSKRRT